MKKTLISMMLAAGFGYAGTALATPVALELALLVDVSSSVNSTEYNLQKQGYINAFKDAAVQAAIASRTNGIAVTYIEWSSSAQQAQLVGWSHLTDAASSNLFADAIAATVRASSGNTAPGSALNYVVPKFENNGFESLRQVIDVSGDGAQNAGDNTAAARDAALAAGIDAINGLPILGEAGLMNWYENNIKGGAGAFVIAASSFDTFENAVKTKIGREIRNDIPAPATLALLGLGLSGLAAVRRRKA